MLLKVNFHYNILGLVVHWFVRTVGYSEKECVYYMCTINEAALQSKRDIASLSKQATIKLKT